MTSRFLRSLDMFRSAPSDLSESTESGGLLSALAFFVSAVLLYCELTAFLITPDTTRLEIDRNSGSLLRINFDLHFFDLACDYLSVGVFDELGDDRVNITQNIVKQRVDHVGKERGRPYSDSELAFLEFGRKRVDPKLKAELDSDWDSSSDEFRHNSFDDVIRAHDFTMVNFYAEWCGHCQQFSPLWSEFEDNVNKGEVEVYEGGSEGDSQPVVRVLRVNCVEFEDLCVDEKIPGFPSVRLYRRTVKKEHEFTPYEGPRGVKPLTDFLTGEIKRTYTNPGSRKYHDVFSEGCNVRGYLDVDRVPGTLHFHARDSSRKTINTAYTNVSHVVNHLAFSNPEEVSMPAWRKFTGRIPREHRQLTAPMDGKTYISSEFHQAPWHYITVIGTYFENYGGLRSYQFAHQHRLAKIDHYEPPQARFQYSLSPMEVVVSAGPRRWYDFLTQVLGILGGTFMIFAFSARFVQMAQTRMKRNLNKLS